MNMVQELELKAFIEAGFVKYASEEGVYMEFDVGGCSFFVDYFLSSDCLVKRFAETPLHEFRGDWIAAVFNTMALAGINIPALYRSALETLAVRIYQGDPLMGNVREQFREAFGWYDFPVNEMAISGEE